MSDYTLTVDDLRALGEKLERASLTDGEKAFLSTAVELAAQTMAGTDEVSGFDFSKRLSMTAYTSPNLGIGFGNSFRFASPRTLPGSGATGSPRSIIIVGG